MACVGVTGGTCGGWAWKEAAVATGAGTVLAMDMGGAIGTEAVVGTGAAYGTAVVRGGWVMC